MLTTPISVPLSYLTFTTEAGYTQQHAGLSVWKTVDDLDRYRWAIETCKPEVLVETGTRWGGFAAWAADTFTIDVITIDLTRTQGRPTSWPRVTFVHGDSVQVAAAVAKMVKGRRCMVSLDSDHHAPHVLAEIDGYAPIVSPGCYLVVEDGLADLLDDDRAIRFGHDIPHTGGPLTAIENRLIGAPGWHRDLDLESLSDISHHPAGWWLRDG